MIAKYYESGNLGWEFVLQPEEVHSFISQLLGVAEETAPIKDKPAEEGDSKDTEGKSDLFCMELKKDEKGEVIIPDGWEVIEDPEEVLTEEDCVAFKQGLDGGWDCVWGLKGRTVRDVVHAYICIRKKSAEKPPKKDVSVTEKDVWKAPFFCDMKKDEKGEVIIPKGWRRLRTPHTLLTEKDCVLREKEEPFWRYVYGFVGRSVSHAEDCGYICIRERESWKETGTQEEV